jgi:7,8-dihydropterin-6-yl-methyl-4-(beta-D-ribofuranosyl)aminobenzene 5'-phosphate synthase
MSNEIRITVLVENSVHTRGLKAEHGLAWHIELGSHQVLFDAGQTDLLVENAVKLGVSLDHLDAVVLSHGHYDHCGGLATVLEHSPRARLFLHPAALHSKFSLQPDGSSRAVGMQDASRAALARNQARVVETRTCTEVVRGLFLTGEISRSTDYEDVGGRFFLDEGGAQPDPLTDDQALFFDTAEGLVVLLGCGHAGVVNTVRHVQQLTGNRPVHTVLGGFHLLNADAHRLERTIVALRDLGIRRLGPAHCTGMAATARFWTDFAGQCVSVAVGARLAFER